MYQQQYDLSHTSWFCLQRAVRFSKKSSVWYSSHSMTKDPANTIVKLTFMRWILPDISINRLFACGWLFHYYKPSLGSISGRLRVRHSKFSESLTHFPCWALLMWSSYMNGEKNLKKCRIPFKQKQSCVPPSSYIIQRLPWPIFASQYYLQKDLRMPRCLCLRGVEGRPPKTAQNKKTQSSCKLFGDVKYRLTQDTE